MHLPDCRTHGSDTEACRCLRKAERRHRKREQSSGRHDRPACSHDVTRYCHAPKRNSEASTGLCPASTEPFCSTLACYQVSSMLPPR